MLLYITLIDVGLSRSGDHHVSYPNSRQLNYPLLNYQLLQLRHRLRLPQANATLFSYGSCVDTAFFLSITRRFHPGHDPFEPRRLRGDVLLANGIHGRTAGLCRNAKMRYIFYGTDLGWAENGDVPRVVPRSSISLSFCPPSPPSIPLIPTETSATLLISISPFFDFR